ncbi:hypothetical protein TWF481_002629 [Arthrobotrys musiformis]|uniref:NB-ARC domain-containing protein n=1 Tax=Arthrobotrys musiformis TaxID=47236 RepID=A0AAV9VSR0_9PEZI
MGAVSALIRAARGVSQSYDYIQELFDGTKVILARYEVHAKKKNIPLELRAVYIEILACVLEIVGVSTKYIADGRAKRFAKGIFQPDDPAAELKERLRKLVDQETAMVGALSLNVTVDVLAQTTLTGEISKNMDLKIDGIVESLGNIFGRLEAGAADRDAAPAKIRDLNFAVPPRMPFPQNRAFTGREEELGAIDRCFNRCFAVPSSGDAPVVCALVGTGGMGKTQLALQYAYQRSDRFTAVFWVSAATEEAVRTSFVDIVQRIVEEQARASWPEFAPDYGALGVRLGIPGLVDGNGTVSSDPKTIGDVQSALFRWLQLPGNRRWLLIFDNADDLETFSVQEYFPNHGGGAILVTSRRQEFSQCAELVDLGGLDRESAVELLLRLARPSDSTEAVRNDATAIVEKLGFMPLAISHAGCFMHESGVLMGEYLRYYEEAFMTVQSKKPRFGWNYRNDTAATAWELSFSEIRKQDEEAASLLLTCSYLDPNEIPESLWEDERSDMESRLQQKSRVSLLASYSLIKRGRAGAFSVHPVVHTWARERLSGEDRLRAMEGALEAIGGALLREELSRSSNKWDGREERRIVGHAEHLGRHLKPKLAELLQDKRRGGGNEETLATVNDIASVFGSQGKYDEAMQWYEQALAGSEKALGKDHLDTLATVHGIASVFLGQGKYDEAMMWYERALASEEKALGKDHPDTLATVHGIASVFLGQGKYDEAMMWYERALASEEKALGKDHPDTLATVHGIASVFLGQGKYDEAMMWYERALASEEKALGKDHPDTLATVNNIASVFHSQGKYDEAMTWYERALAGSEKALGKDHPNTLATVTNIASVFRDQGKYDEAMMWYERALAGSEKALGKDHPNTLATVNNITSVFLKQGKCDEAMMWYERALAGREKALGKDHPATLTTVNNIAAVFHSQGKYDEAMTWYERALAGSEKALGKDHPDTLVTVNNIAQVFDEQGKYDEAMQRYERAPAGSEKALGKDHPDTLATVNDLGRVSCKTMPRYKRAFAGFKRALGRDRPPTPH